MDRDIIPQTIECLRPKSVREFLFLPRSGKQGFSLNRTDIDRFRFGEFYIPHTYRWVSPLVLVLIFSVHWSFLVLMYWYWYWYWYWSNFQVLTLYWYWSRKYWANQYQYQNKKNSKNQVNKLAAMKFSKICQIFLFKFSISNSKMQNCSSKFEFSAWKTDFSLENFKFRGQIWSIFVVLVLVLVLSVLGLYWYWSRTVLNIFFGTYWYWYWLANSGTDSSILTPPSPDIGAELCRVHKDQDVQGQCKVPDNFIFE